MHQIKKGIKLKFVENSGQLIQLCAISRKTTTKLSTFEQNGKNVKRIMMMDKEDLDGPVLKWFKQQKTMNIPIRGPMLMTKAEQLAKLLGHENFVCSSGWID